MGHMSGQMTETAVRFWQSYIATLPAEHPHRGTQVSAFAFGDSPALAGELSALVRAGKKTATASLPVQFTAAGARVPAAGDVSIVTLSDGTPVAIIETTEVRLVEFGAVDAALPPPKGRDIALSCGDGQRTESTSAAFLRGSVANLMTPLSSSATASG